METAPPIFSPEQIRAMMLLAPDTLGAWASGGLWQAARHLQFISDKIERAVAKGNGRLIVNLPPRTGKSELLCKWTPIWFLENWPRRKVITCSHGSELAAGFGRAVRNEFATNPRLRTRLREDSKAANRWNTVEGGGMYTAGVGTGILGFGADLILVDDPYPSWSDAFSFNYRQHLEEWWGSSLMTRAEPNATVVLLHHRFHPDDITSFLQRDPNYQWDVIRLPALAEANDPLGRAEGESIWPERWSVDDFSKKRGPHFEPMYQQNPSGVGVGALYNGFSEANVEAVAYDPGKPLCFALDFNINPGMHALIGQYCSIADRFDVLAEIHEPRMDLPGCVKVFERWYREHATVPQVVKVYCDASGKQTSILNKNESLHIVLQNRLTQAGIRHSMHVRASNPPVMERVTSVNDALKDGHGARHVRIHPQCVRLLADMRDMKADEHGGIDKHNAKLSHASDAFGYWVHFVRPLRIEPTKDTRPIQRSHFIFGKAG